MDILKKPLSQQLVNGPDIISWIIAGSQTPLENTKMEHLDASIVTSTIT